MYFIVTKSDKFFDLQFFLLSIITNATYMLAWRKEYVRLQVRRNEDTNILSITKHIHKALNIYNKHTIHYYSVSIVIISCLFLFLLVLI